MCYSNVDFDNLETEKLNWNNYGSIYYFLL